MGNGIFGLKRAIQTPLNTFNKKELNYSILAYPILGDRHYAGIFIAHTATRGHDFFIDFKIDPILPPPTPLLIGNTHFLSSKTLELYLNKAIRVQHDISTLFVLESRYDSVRYTSQKVYSSSPNSLTIEWNQPLPYHRYNLWHPILLST